MSDLPPRASVDDVDYDPHRYVGLTVKLDGAVQQVVCAYDVPNGTVTRAVLDDRGFVQLEPGTDQLWLETVRGVVEISRT